jgi:hypothetical protein
VKVISNHGAEIHVRHDNGTLILRPGYNTIADNLMDVPYVQGLLADGTLVNADEIKEGEEQPPRPPRLAAHEMDTRAEPPTEFSQGAADPEGEIFGTLTDDQRASLEGLSDEERSERMRQFSNPTRASEQNQGDANQRDIKAAQGEQPQATGPQAHRQQREKFEADGKPLGEDGKPLPLDADGKPINPDKETKAEAKEVAGADKPAHKPGAQHHSGKK